MDSENVDELKNQIKADILVRQNDFDDIIRFYKRTKPSMPVKTGIISPQSRRKVEFTHPKAHKLHSMWQNGKFSHTS